MRRVPVHIADMTPAQREKARATNRAQSRMKRAREKAKRQAAAVGVSVRSVIRDRVKAKPAPAADTLAAIRRRTVTRKPTAEQFLEPPRTPALALQFVKMLHAGIPALTAIQYIGRDWFTTLPRVEQQAWYSEWVNSKEVLEAVTLFNHGDWQDLEKDTRIEIALAKHCSELAYFLYTHNYADLSGEDLRKGSEARTALMELMRENKGEADGPYLQAMKDLLAGKLSEILPPKLAGTVVIPTVKES